MISCRLVKDKKLRNKVKNPYQTLLCLFIAFLTVSEKPHCSGSPSGAQ